jgi:hypothetical protein
VGKATQFKPGFSGNAGGRPKNKPITAAYLDLLHEKLPPALRKLRMGKARVDLPEEATYLNLIVLAQCIEAATGNPAAMKEITDRIEGKMSKPIEVTGSEGGPLDIQLLTDEQLDARIRELLAGWQNETANEPEPES